MTTVLTNLDAALEPILRKRVGDERFELWIRGKTRVELGGGRIKIGVPNHFYLTWLQKTFAEDLQAAAQELGLVDRIVFEISPVLFQAARQRQEEHKETAPAIAAEPGPLPPEVLNVGVDGHGVDFNILRVGCRTMVRFVSELTYLWFHYVDDGYRLCVGERCQRCPDKRHRSGYGDGIVARPDPTGRPKPARVIQVIPESGLQFLEPVKQLRGVKAEFLRRTRFAMEVRILEETCLFELPPPINVRRPLVRKYHLTGWPAYEMPLFDGELE